MSDSHPLVLSKSPVRRRLMYAVGGLAIVAGAAAAALYFYADTLVERRLRPATIDLLARRFDSEVQLDSLSVRVFPTLGVRGQGLTLRHQGRRDIPPVIAIREFTITAGLRELWSRRIDSVRLDGLEMSIPPRRGAEMPSLTPRAQTPQDGKPDVHIGELLAENSLLTIMSKREGKRPRVFQLRRLRFENLEFARPTSFEAAITNPTPAGEIEARGSFGPWNGEEPSITPVEGTFVFDADLATIKGIGGALHAEGMFDGPLDYIRTSGRTRTTDFHLSTGGAKFPLLVDYEAIVDGTNGDTTLEKVDGKLAESQITARGEIVKVEGTNGRRITLDVTTTGGRIEDFVKLTTRVQESPLVGVVNVKATLDIPPGEPEVIERMDLAGTFDLKSARFTSAAIQARVDELSRRGRGRPTDESIDNVASNLRGRFHLKDARMDVRTLTFTVQGAQVRLAGRYDVTTERMNFTGELRLQARASQTQTGWKSVLLRVFDPLLDGKGAGTVLPISITGTKNNPKFGVDFKKALFR